MQTEHPHAPEPGHARTVVDGVRWVRMALPLALNHVNLWLLEDGDGWTAVDSGMALEPTREAWRRLRKSHRLRRQVITHLHPDHLGLAAWLEAETGAPVWMTAAEHATALLWYHGAPGHDTAALVAHLRAHGLEEARLEGLARRGNTYRLGVAGIPERFQAIADGDAIDVGGRRWRVLTGHGHSPEHACLHCPEAGILVSGDLLLPRITTNVSTVSSAPHVDALCAYLTFLDRLEELPADTLVLPSHGAPFHGLRPRVAALRTHHAQRLAALLRALAAGPRSAADLLPVLFDRPIDDPFQCMFAMGECIAHLVHLERNGSMERLEQNGTVRFAVRP